MTDVPATDALRDVSAALTTMADTDSRREDRVQRLTKRQWLITKVAFTLVGAALSSVIWLAYGINHRADHTSKSVDQTLSLAQGVLSPEAKAAQAKSTAALIDDLKHHQDEGNYSLEVFVAQLLGRPVPPPPAK